LKRFIEQFSPTAWVGSRTSIVEANAKLLDQLEEYPDPGIREFTAKEKIRLAQAITAVRQIERQTDERFE